MSPKFCEYEKFNPTPAELLQTGFEHQSPHYLVNVVHANGKGLGTVPAVTRNAVHALLQRREDVWITPDTMRLMHRLLRLELPGTNHLRQHYAQTFKDTEKVTRAAGLNEHDEAHQWRGASMGACIGLVHGLPERIVRSAQIGGNHHDDYSKYLEKYSMDELAAMENKRAFDDHPLIGAATFEKAMRDSLLRRVLFRHLSDEEKQTATQNILHHSSDSYGYQPFNTRTPFGDVLTRFGDKSDHVRNRSLLSPDSMESILKRDDAIHKLAPHPIRTYFLNVNKSKREYNMYYVADLDRTSSVLRREYAVEEHRNNFRGAYYVSFLMAAEVADKGFQYEGLRTDRGSFFKVHTHYLRGGRQVDQDVFTADPRELLGGVRTRTRARYDVTPSSP